MCHSWTARGGLRSTTIRADRGVLRRAPVPRFPRLLRRYTKPALHRTAASFLSGMALKYLRVACGTASFNISIPSRRRGW